MQASGGSLHPYQGDGIDVQSFPGGATFDVLLTDESGALFAGESKCLNTQSIKRKDLAVFAYDVERLRKLTGQPVEGRFFVKKELVQRGALAVAEVEGITVFVLGDERKLPAYSATVVRYDADREQRIRLMLESFGEGATASDDMAAEVLKPGGNKDE